MDDEAALKVGFGNNSDMNPPIYPQVSYESL